jgi:hypothetical protein
VRGPSRASMLGCLGRKRPQSIQREPSSSDSRGGRSQTWPRAESWRAAVWWVGHWSWKVWRRVAKEMGEIGFMVGGLLSGAYGFWYVLDASCSVGVEGDRCCFVRVVALRLLRLTYAGRSPPGRSLCRSRVHPRADGRSRADCHDTLWCDGRRCRLFRLNVCCHSCSIGRR